MSPLPFFKKKKEEPKPIPEKKEAVLEVKKEEQNPPAGGPKALEVSAEGVLRRPRVTEKASTAAERNEYVFEVYPETNKIQVKNAVEKTYKVNVLNVNMVNLPSKVKRIGKRLGKTAAVRKAIVRLEKGQSIDIMPRKP